MTSRAHWTTSLLVMGHFLSSLPASSAIATISSPDELAGAIEAASPGSVLLLSDGAYESLRITLEAEGEPGRPIVLRAETPGNVTITGNSRLTISARHLVVEGLIFEKALGKCIVAFRGARNCRMTDCAFVNCGDPESTFSHIITMREGSRNNTVDHCYMEGNLSMGMGVRVAESDYQNTDNHFTHNYFRNVVRRWHNGQEAIQVGQSTFSRDVSVRTLVEYCLFESVDGDVEIISNKSSDNVYRYNTFRECKHSELVLRGGNRATVEGNFFLNGKGGVRVHGAQHRITNNCFENLDRALFLQHGDQAYQPIVDCLIANNLIVNCTQCAIDLGPVRTQGEVDQAHDYYQPPTRTVFEGNIIVGATGSLIRLHSERETVWNCNIAWPTMEARVGLESPGLEVLNPQLVKVNAIYQLPRPNSPAIERRLPSGECEHLGPAGKLADRATASADTEATSDGPVARRPLQPTDVGPRWMNGDPARAHRIKRE